mgnify:FL=1
MSLDHSYPWYFSLLCVFLGVFVTYFFYRENNNLKPFTKSFLFFIRFSILTSLFFLLLSPIFNIVIKNIERPSIILLQDASKSVRIDIKNDFKKIQNELLDFDVSIYNFSDQLNEGFADTNLGLYTNIDLALTNINDLYSNRNLSSVVIATDGLYNRGKNPLYSEKFNFPIYSLILGDTAEQVDISIDKIEHNELAFLGNYFPVKIRIKSTSAKNKNFKLKIRQNDSIIFTKSFVSILNNEYFEIKEDFLANKIGMNKYSISISEFSNEQNIINNYADFFIDIIDSKSKILIFNDKPHPDIAAFVSSISSNENYDYTISKTENYSLDFSDFNLIVFHSIKNLNEKFILEIFESKIPLLLFCTNDFNNINTFFSSVDFLNKGSVDEVYPFLSSTFDDFQLSDSVKNMISLMPPLKLQFGSYFVNNPSKVLLYQKIKDINSLNPLISFENIDKRIGIIFGEGYWKWRLRNFYLNNSHNSFDDFFNKVIQYLVTNEDKSKLRLDYNKSYFENESIIISAELYNSSFDLYNEKNIELKLFNSKNEIFDYNFDKYENSYSLNIGALESDNYRFEVFVKDSDVSTKTGVITVKPVKVEELNLISDYNFLNNLSSANNGSLFWPNEINLLISEIKSSKSQKIIRISNDILKLIDINSLLIFLLFFIFLEWFIRKYNGLI